MSNCLPDLDYSSTHRNNRLSQACNVLGSVLVNRIIAFTLFLFGANRKDIAKYLQVPHDILLSFYTRVTKFGFPVLKIDGQSPHNSQRQGEMTGGV